MISYFFRGISVETLKLKRSLALWIALIIPLFPSVANIVDGLQHGMSTPLEDAANRTPWSMLFYFAFRFWTILALPMIVAILSALMANTDHPPKAWKMLFALPFPRSAIFAGKWFGLAGLVLISNLVFTLANLVGGILIHYLRPDAGLEFPIPVGEALFAMFISWLLSLLMISIHLWISLRWSSFLVSIILGFSATVSNLFLIASYLYGKSAISPWAMPVQVYGDWQSSMPAALLGALLVSLLAGGQFTRRDAI